jgi:alkanesulfonate monooxygenase SsuD/methylene tetrahydromethanopterin reductase-like flavin-dependent oxidoreductase (luciferase family)
VASPTTRRPHGQTLGIGAGRAWDQIAGLGGPRRSPREAVAAVSEAIDVLHGLWLPGRTITMPGQYYELLR